MALKALLEEEYPDLYPILEKNHIVTVLALSRLTGQQLAQIVPTLHEILASQVVSLAVAALEGTGSAQVASNNLLQVALVEKDLESKIQALSLQHKNEFLELAVEREKFELEKAHAAHRREIEDRERQYRKEQEEKERQHQKDLETQKQIAQLEKEVAVLKATPSAPTYPHPYPYPFSYGALFPPNGVSAAGRSWTISLSTQYPINAAYPGLNNTYASLQSLDTANSGASTHSGADQWIKADFGMVVQVNRVKIGPYMTGWGTSYTQGLEVQISNDNSSWYLVLTVSCTSNAVVVHALPFPVGCRYVRLRRDNGYCTAGVFVIE